MILTVLALLYFLVAAIAIIVLTLRWKKQTRSARLGWVLVIICYTLLGCSDMMAANRKKEKLRHWKVPIVEVEVYLH